VSLVLACLDEKQMLPGHEVSTSKFGRIRSFSRTSCVAVVG
jgi:hypothetical protein